MHASVLTPAELELTQGTPSRCLVASFKPGLPGWATGYVGSTITKTVLTALAMPAPPVFPCLPTCRVIGANDVLALGDATIWAPNRLPATAQASPAASRLAQASPPQEAQPGSTTGAGPCAMDGWCSLGSVQGLVQALCGSCVVPAASSACSCTGLVGARVGRAHLLPCARATRAPRNAWPAVPPLNLLLCAGGWPAGRLRGTPHQPRLPAGQGGPGPGKRGGGRARGEGRAAAVQGLQRELPARHAVGKGGQDAA